MADSTRREFVKQAALGTVALAALSPARVLGANDRVRVGMIGVGGRGQELLKQVQQVPNAQLVAVADIYSLHGEQAKQMAPGIDVVDDHRRLLERKDIDAVIVSTPLRGRLQRPGNAWRQRRSQIAWCRLDCNTRAQGRWQMREIGSSRGLSGM
jgi:hypothetical protein